MHSYQLTLFFVLLLYCPRGYSQSMRQVVLNASDVSWFQEGSGPESWHKIEPWNDICPEALGRFETPNLFVASGDKFYELGLFGGLLDVVVVVPTRVDGGSAKLRLTRVPDALGDEPKVVKEVDVSSAQQGNDPHCVLAHLYSAQLDDPPAPDPYRLGGYTEWTLDVSVDDAELVPPKEFPISTIVIQTNPDVAFVGPEPYTMASTTSTAFTTSTSTMSRSSASTSSTPKVPTFTAPRQQRSHTLPIALGAVLGTVALIGLLVALYVRRMRRNRQAKIELMVPNYDPETLASPPDIGVSTPLLSATLQPQLSPISETTGADGAAPDVGFILYASPTKKKRDDTSSVVDTAVDEKAQLQRGSSTAPPQSGSSGSQISAVAESSDAAGNGIGTGSEMGGKRVMDEDAGIVVGELQPPASPTVGDSNGEDPPPMYTPRE
ncbi:hypothetical protein EXIGLDRAFT_755591 [Exidia glandulosa HHB12029]|uniref:Uncharacterized protein n=1 Tax=Exidia glandulosa HHB12029 TaxID=1314781 RepID=A0A165BXL8_EXIGL|nr:hypothetical protein EXIGLDRAFT_755591 [Exidia glandulosa HHB12029]